MEATPPPTIDAPDGATENVAALRDALADNMDARALRRAAQKWASVCLEDMAGTLLGKGLEVARALAEFATELEEG